MFFQNIVKTQTKKHLSCVYIGCINPKKQSRMEMNDIVKMLLAAQGRLRKYAYSLTKDGDRAEDLLQETFMKVLYNAERFDDKGKFIYWASAIMHNAFINNCEREERYKTISELLRPAPFDAKNYEGEPTDSYVEIDDIYSAIDDLPGNAGKVMRLLIGGHKYVEISVMMNIPLGTVKTRINLSRAILKHKLKDYLN